MKKGFTLIELAVGMLVATILTLSLWNLYGIYVKGSAMLLMNCEKSRSNRIEILMEIKKDVRHHDGHPLEKLF